MCVVTEKQFPSVPVLSLIKSAQQQHGLRHGDYQRYHQYISRKLRRIRKSLHFQQGTRSKVVPKKIIAEIVCNPRYIIMAIFEIERSWAFAMQLKAESNTELRKRFQMASRLRKAVARADALCNISDELSSVDAQTKLEIRAYKQWIRGVLHFELRDWVKAKESLESSQAIYSVLLQMVDEDSQTVYQSRIDDLLPQVRYCAYTISGGDQTAASDLQRMMLIQAKSGILAEMQLDQLLDQARLSQASQVTEVQWLGITIPVKLEKAKVAILTVQESDGDLVKAENHQSKLALYESALKSCVEAMTAIRTELKVAVVSEASAIGDKGTAAIIASTKTGQTLGSDKISRLQLLYTYLQYLKLAKTIDRTSLHVDIALDAVSKNQSVAHQGLTTSAYPKPQELSRLYDTMVQNFQELISLSYGNQDHVGFKDLLHAKMTAYRSLRCYYLALAYNNGKKYSECSALLARAQSHAQNAISSLSSNASTWTSVEENAVPGMSPDKLIVLLTALIQQTDAEDLTCRASCMLDMVETNDSVHNSAQGDADLSHKMLIDRLDNFVNEKIVEKSFSLPHPFVQSPPNFEPVPVKPIFFDLALNYINFPSLIDKIDAKSSSKSSTGLTGMMRGWLWGDDSKNESSDS